MRISADICGACWAFESGRRLPHVRGLHARQRPAFGRRGRGEEGQASLEYLLVGTVLMIVAVGLAALWRFAADGRFERIVDACASHAVSTGGALDVFLF